MLGSPPVRTRVEEAIQTMPGLNGGYLWAMGEHGSLFRINPHERDGRPAEVCTRLWAGAAAHAFVIRELERTSGATLTEPFAVVATRERISAWGLISQAARSFSALEQGEEILADARDHYQLIEAAGAVAWCLSQREGSTWLVVANLSRNEAKRHAIGLDAGPVCGPAIMGDRIVTWSSREVLTLAGEVVERQSVPPGVELWTAPSDNSGLRLPLGRPPCIAVAGSMYLPCDHYGAPALLRAQALSSGWSFSAIPIPNAGGTLSQDRDGSPLLASGARLYRCVGGSFREVAADDQMSSRYAAFHFEESSIYFCEGDYGVRSHSWLQARAGTTEQRVNWSLAPNQVLKECGGFWMVAGGLTTQLLVEDRRMVTEFVSWHA
ncbi:MAG TPA: hypothetical protein VGD59_12735 [Acidisarcina sp.]